jgi:hypothetical protein
MPPRAKSTAKKVRKNTKKTNLTKLYNQMHKMSLDAVDNEIIKRFKILIDASEEDVPKTDIDQLISDPKSADTSLFPEGLQPYVKHYVFMTKRDKSQKKTAAV